MSSSNSNKVSFSVQSKSNHKSSKLKSTTTHHELQTTTKQFVTEFDPNETLPPHSKSQSRIIIPRKPDQSHHPSRKMKNLEAALSHSTTTTTAFEQQTNPDDAQADNISYGLNLRLAANPDSRSEPPVENSGGLLKDVKLDIDTLPDDEGFREFDEMPVEEFGAALLGGLGWYKSRGIGKNPKGDIEIKQVEKKSFVSDDINITTITQKEKDREGEKNVNSNSNREGEKNINSNSNSKYEDRDRKVQHQESEKRVRVDNRSRESERREKREKREERERVGWLRSHIRVRIISKELKRGRLYLKKGEVVDVVGPNTCDISMDESRELVQGVDQDLLETALPKRGGPVLVLYGRHKGVYGNLVERDLDRETGVVRDADTHDLLNVKLEQIAEYTGDPSYIGY